MGERKATSGADWAVIEPYDAPMEICWNFDYAISAEKLGKLYQKSKRLQWDAMEEMDWDYEVDPSGQLMTTDTSVYMTMPFFKKLSKTQREDFVAHQACHLLSQFLHGEQGALMTASAITHAVPDYDAKLYAATQTMDEARHVEVYEKYINKVGVTYPIMPGLKDIIDVTLQSGNYMKIMVGMNMVIEGLALAAFHNIRQQTSCKLLKHITEYVLRDEARHVAFGNVYLSQAIKDLHPDDREDIAEFAFTAVKMMHDRLWRDEGTQTDDPSLMMMFENSNIDPADFAKGVQEAKELGIEPNVNPGTVNDFKDLMMPALVRVGAVTKRSRELYAKEGIPVWDDTSVLEAMENAETGEFQFDRDAASIEEAQHEAEVDRDRVDQALA